MNTITEAMRKLNESDNDYQDRLDEIGNDSYWIEMKDKIQELVDQVKEVRTSMKDKLKM